MSATEPAEQDYGVHNKPARVCMMQTLGVRGPASATAGESPKGLDRVCCRRSLRDGHAPFKRWAAGERPATDRRALSAPRGSRVGLFGAASGTCSCHAACTDLRSCGSSGARRPEAPVSDARGGLQGAEVEEPARGCALVPPCNLGGSVIRRAPRRYELSLGPRSREPWGAGRSVPDCLSTYVLKEARGDLGSKHQCCRRSGAHRMIA